MKSTRRGFISLGEIISEVTVNDNLNLTGDLLGNDLDAISGTLFLGKSTATRVEIGDTLVITEIEGPLICTEYIQSDEIDSETANTLFQCWPDIDIDNV
jgi:hypothetical protein